MSRLSRTPSPSVSMDRGFVPFVTVSKESPHVSPSVSDSWGSVIQPSRPYVVSSESFKPSASVSARIGDVRIVNRMLYFSRIPPEAQDERERVYVPPPNMEVPYHSSLSFSPSPSVSADDGEVVTVRVMLAPLIVRIRDRGLTSVQSENVSPSVSVKVAFAL